MAKIHGRIGQVQATTKLTQGEFGRRIGVSASHVSKVVAEKDDPSEQMILGICREFGVREDWLRRGVGTMFKSTDELLAEIEQRLGSDVRLEIALMRAKAKHYDEMMGLVFNQVGSVGEGSAQYHTTGVSDPRRQKVVELIDRIFKSRNEKTIAAIEFILRQADPGDHEKEG